MKNDLKLTLRVSADDMAALKSHTQATRLSQSGYIRMLIHGKVPKAYPPKPFYETMELLRERGEIMSVVADIVQRGGDKSIQEYRTISNHLLAKILKIEEAVLEPEIIEDG